MHISTAAQPGKANLGQPPAGLDAARRFHAAVDDPRAAVERADGDAELLGIGDHCIAKFVGALIECGHAVIVALAWPSRDCGQSE